MRPKLTLAVLVIATAMFAGTSAAHATSRPTADQELQRIAGQVTHGWLDDQQRITNLLPRYRAGERLYLTCGTVSTLAMLQLRHLGYTARVVQTFTTQAWNGIDDGHTMLEVRSAGRWQVYDLDNNRQPVDAHGQGITAQQFARGTRRHYRILAHDQRVNYTGTSFASYSGLIYTNHRAFEQWYDRVLGVVQIAAPDNTWWFTTGSSALRRRIEALDPGVYRWVSPQKMASLYR